MEKHILSAVLLAMLPFLLGSVSKEPARTLLPIEDDFLTRTASAPSAPAEEVGRYMFRYIADAGDTFSPDVNIFTQVSGIEPKKGGDGRLQALPVPIPGHEVDAQKLFDAIANRNPIETPVPISGSPTWVQVGVETSSVHKGLWRYYIHVGRSTLYNAYSIIPPQIIKSHDPAAPSVIIPGNCSSQFVEGPNGHTNRACDVEALKRVRACLQMKVTGKRVAKENFENQ